MDFFKRTIAWFCFLAMAVLAGCGGGTADSGSAPTQTRLLTTATVSPANHTTIVQQLYISYFGRPADTGGLANFKAQMAVLNGPADIQALDQAYRSNPGIKALVDSFGISAESAALYSGDNTAFVTAIYRNILNRAPDAEGLAFWAGAINSGSLTRANASLAIMAGGLANVSTQGKLDAALINRKVVIGSSFTDKLIAAPVNGYSGDGPAARARAMLSSVNATTDTAAFAATISALVQSMADNLAGSVPVANFAGLYTGTFAGADAGTFTVTLSSTGAISGSGSSPWGPFTVAGQVTAGGSVSLNSSGSAGTATFSGTVTSTGAFAGTWDDGEDGGGTFTGQKQ